MPGLDQLLDSMRTDIARPSGNHHVHVYCSFLARIIY